MWGEALFIEQHCRTTHQPPAHQHTPSTTAKVSSTVVLCPRGAKGLRLGAWPWHILSSVPMMTRVAHPLVCTNDDEGPISFHQQHV